MRDCDDVMPLFMTLGAVLTKYSRIERKPIDFGLGVTLHPAEIHMVSALDALGGSTVTGLAKACGVTKGAISQMLKRLVEKGLVLRESDAARARVSLTALGKQASQAHYAFHREHDRDFLDYLRGLSDSDFRACLELLRRMKVWMAAYPE